MADTITCSYCGKTINMRFYKQTLPFTKQMKDRQLCCECMFWLDIADRSNRNFFMIDNVLYRISPLTTKKRLNHNMAFIMDTQSADIIASEDFETIGTVPPRFRHLFHGQYQFISKRTYSIIRAHEGGPCMKKGCFDRYQCFWYRKDIAEPDGPWNIIPDTHHIGDEMCESFINKNTLYDTDHPSSAHPID